MKSIDKFLFWVKCCRAKFLLWRIQQTCRRGKHLGGPPKLTLDAATMRESDGHEYAIKIRVEVIQCVYCDHVMELKPLGIVDMRPPVRDDDA